jgi:hypothetical protein
MITGYNLWNKKPVGVTGTVLDNMLTTSVAILRLLPGTRLSLLFLPPSAGLGGAVLSWHALANPIKKDGDQL